MITCVKCQAKYGTKKMGVPVIETAGNPPKAYRIWTADLLSCPICAAEVTTNYSHEPMIERHEDGFATVLKSMRDKGGFVLHNPEYLAMRVQGDTAYVRQYEHKS